VKRVTVSESAALSHGESSGRPIRIESASAGEDGDEDGVEVVEVVGAVGTGVAGVATDAEALGVGGAEADDDAGDGLSVAVGAPATSGGAAVEADAADGAPTDGPGDAGLGRAEGGVLDPHAPPARVAAVTRTISLRRRRPIEPQYGDRRSVCSPRIDGAAVRPATPRATQRDGDWKALYARWENTAGFLHQSGMTVMVPA
jgi:hypothetical protein